MFGATVDVESGNALARRKLKNTGSWSKEMTWAKRGRQTDPGNHVTAKFRSHRGPFPTTSPNGPRPPNPSRPLTLPTAAVCDSLPRWPCPSVDERLCSDGAQSPRLGLRVAVFDSADGRTLGLRWLDCLGVPVAVVATLAPRSRLPAPVCHALGMGNGALLERPPDCGRHDSEKGEPCSRLSDPTCDGASGGRSRGADR